MEHDMRATNFLLDPPGVSEAWAAKPASRTARKQGSGNTPEARPLTLLQRLARWLWKQQVREREAYLAQSKDIFELEQRLRDLERIGGRYY
jgi:hypothetical protein